MKYPIYIAILALFLPTFSVYPQALTYEERIADNIVKSNIIMKKIYGEIWRIRNRYNELRDFGPDNYANTPELPIQYQTIKGIRIKSNELQKKFSLFKMHDFRGDRDVIYICFSDKSKAFGTITQPFFGVYIEELAFYVLMYANTDNTFLKHDIVNILKRNAKIVEQISY